MINKYYHVPPAVTTKVYLKYKLLHLLVKHSYEAIKVIFMHWGGAERERQMCCSITWPNTCNWGAPITFTKK